MKRARAEMSARPDVESTSCVSSSPRTRSFFRGYLRVGVGVGVGVGVDGV